MERLQLEIITDDNTTTVKYGDFLDPSVFACITCSFVKLQD